MVRLVVLGVLVLASRSPAVELEGHARLWLGPGFDSNARRDFVSAGAATVPDGFLFGLAQLEGRILADRFRFEGAYDAAGRKFIAVPSEDTLVQSAVLQAGAQLIPALELTLLGRARDRRGAGRDYTDLQAGGAIDLTPHRDWRVSLSGVAHRFLYYNRFEYSYWAPDVAAAVRFRFLRRHSVTASGTFGWRTYNDVARPPPGGMPTGEPRVDVVWSAGAQWAFRGPFHLSAGYAFFSQASRSWGESLSRHRLSATAGVPLPLDFTVLLTAALQLARYPDGVYLSPDLQVVEDDESSSSVTLKVVRPLGKHVELDVRYSFLVNVLPQNRFLYLRHVVSVGVAVAF